jgi:signal transduction histidine kinase
MRPRPDLSTAYRAEAEALTAERFAPAVALFLTCAVGFGVFEYLYDPASLLTFLVLYCIQLLVALPPALTTGWLLRRRLMVRTSIAVGVVLSVLPHVQTVLIGLPTELMGIATVCTVTGMALVMPWGRRGQALIAAANLIAYAVTLYIDGSAATDPAFLFFAVLTGAALSVLGAHYLDLHRFAIFREATLSEEEAAVNRKLVAIAKEINAVLGRPDALNRICDSTRAALGCGWTLILLNDETSGIFRVAGGVSPKPDALREVSALEFAPGSFPLIDRILGNELVDIPSPTATDPVTGAFMLRWQTRYMLATKLTRSGQVIGILAAGGSEEVDAISARVRQLFRGIAPHASIALNNVRLVADLRRADQLKSEFLSTMSHELRTPLNVILGYTELLAEDTFGPLSDEQHDTVGRVHENARSLLELINATLDVSRIEAGRLPVQLGEVSLRALFRDLHDELQQLPRGPEVGLCWDVAVDGTRVRTDPSKLKIIVKNLVGNALKFTQSGEVSVHATYDSRMARLHLAVADTGVGIAADDLAHIFDMFRQAGNGHHLGGVGLGLYIVKRFVEQLEGQVSVASTPGTGTTFTLSIPVVSVAHESTVQQHAA